MPQDRIAFHANMPIVELEREYRERYAGSEYDIRFSPMEENMLRFHIEIMVPHIISMDDDLKKQLEPVIERALREMVHACGRIGSDILAKRKAGG